MLYKSLKPGKYKDYLQWYITRIYTSSYVNICSAGFMGLGSDNLESSDINMVIKTTPTRGTRFERFVRGNKKRTVITKRKMFGLLVEALHAVLEDVEEDWGRTK